MQAKVFLYVFLLCLTRSESYGVPSRHWNVRIQRDAESLTSTENVAAVAPSSPSPSMSSTTTPSGHESHSVDCQNVDKMSLEKSCSDEKSCPKDEETAEKCCHCISKCCSGAMMTSEGMGAMEGSTPQPGSSGVNNGTKKAGDKMKDAVNSAESWIKNAGQNIKSSWDKAKDSIKQTAGDVKDKVKKGINSVAGKVKNATDNDNEGSKMNCNEKDGKCSTDMPMDNTSSSEPSSEEASKPAPTRAPGHKKMKRDVYRSNYPSSLYGNRNHYLGNTGFSGLGHYDNTGSDSNEYAFRKTTTTTTGARDINRRFKRSSPDFMTKNATVPESASKSTSSSKDERHKRSSVYFPTEPSSEGNSSTTISQSSSTTTTNENGNRSRSRYRRSSNSAKTNATSDSASSATTAKNTTESSPGKREKRSPIMTASTTSPPCTATATPVSNDNETSRHSKREAKKDDSTTQEDVGSPEQATSSTEKEDKGKGKGAPPPSNSTFSIFVHMIGPGDAAVGKEETTATTTSKSQTIGGGSRPGGGKSIKFPPPAPIAPQHRPALGMIAPNSIEFPDSQVDLPPVVVYPDGQGMFSPSSHNRPNRQSLQGHNQPNCTGERRKRSSGNGESYYQDYNPDEEYSQYYSTRDKTPDMSMSNSNSWGGGGHSHSSNMAGSGWSQGGSLGGGTLMESPFQNSNHHQSTRYNPLKHHQNSGMEDGMNGGGTLDSVNLGDDETHHYHSEDTHYNYHGQGNSRNNSDKSYHHHQSHNNNKNNHNNHHNNHKHQGDDSNHSSPNYESEGDTYYEHGVVSSADAEENSGACRPLASRSKCASLKADSVECLYDTDCSGSKKCCFYHCEPMKIIGLCEQVQYTVTKS